MAYRPQAAPYPVIEDGDMSANVTSLVTIIQKLSMCSYSYSWSGSSPVGEIVVELSNDYALDSTGAVKNAGTWNAMTLNYGGAAVDSVPLSGNTGNGLIDIEAVAAYAIRTRYVRTSGTGTLNSIFVAKVT